MIPLSTLSSAGVTEELQMKAMIVMMTVLRKRMRKKRSKVVSNSILVGHTLGSLTILPTEGLLIIIRQGWQTL
jgi:uncharacterized protein with PhoU and TrkA domain